MNDALALANVDVPGGRTNIGGREQTLRVLGASLNVDQIRNIVIPAGTGGFVRLSDIADVGDGAAEVRGRPDMRFAAVGVRIGELSNVDKDALEFAFAALTRNTPLAGLRLALSLRDWKRPRGELYDVRVPGLPCPVALRAGTSDARVLRQIFVEEELEFRLEGEPQLIVDAGANIGLSSIYLATRYPTATIVALEIDTRNFAILNRNVRPYPSILPRCVGLWSGRTRLKVANPEAADVNAGVATKTVLSVSQTWYRITYELHPWI